MFLERCTEQTTGTLDEFYARYLTHSNEIDQVVGRTMLSLIARIRSLPDARRVWGLTSHERLCLLAADSGASPWYVMVSALDRRNYHVGYLMPASIAPWPSAFVSGEADSEDEAIHMILVAMEKSGGW